MFRTYISRMVTFHKKIEERNEMALFVLENLFLAFMGNGDRSNILNEVCNEITVQYYKLVQ